MESSETLESPLTEVLTRIAKAPLPSAKASASREDRETQAARAAQWREIIHKLGARYTNCRISELEIYDPRQREAFERATSYCQQMPDHVASGTGIVLFGPTGTGKDHVMAACMRAAVLQYGFTVRWVNGMDLYGDIRDSIGTDARESKVIRDFSQSDILAISDPIPPFGEVTAFQAQTLFRIIDSRYRNMKPTWMTMNVSSAADASTKMGAAVVDRLREGAVTLHCDWGSYRNRKRGA